jgi:hypothetical protein
MIYSKPMTSPRLSASVSAAAVAGILAALFGIFTASLTLVVLAFSPASKDPNLPPYLRVMTTVMMLFFFGLAIFGMITSISVLRLKNWARIAMLVWGGVMTFFSGIALAFMMLIPLPVPPGSAPGISEGFLRSLFAIIYGIPLLIGVWWLILFNRSSVKAQFLNPGQQEGQVPTVLVPRCPLPLALLAGFAIFSVGTSVVFYPLAHLPADAVLFGHLFHGVPAKLFTFVALLLSLTGAIGLLKLRRWSYPLVLALHFFWLLSGTITVLSPNFEQNMRELFSHLNMPESRMVQTSFAQTRSFAILCLIPGILLIWLLLYYHTKFIEACAAREALASQSTH